MDVEIVCRDIIDIAEKLHKEGPASLPIFDEELLKTAARSRDLTYTERIDSMADLVLASKKLCDSLMRSEKHAVFVACAPQKSKDVDYNREANKNKKVVLKLGYEQRDKDKKIQAEIGDEEDEGDEDEGLAKGKEQVALPATANSMRTTANTTSRQSSMQNDSGHHTAHTSSDVQPETPWNNASPPVSGPANNYTRFPSGGHTDIQLVPYQDDDFLPSNRIETGSEHDAFSQSMLEHANVRNASGSNGGGSEVCVEAVSAATSSVTQSRKRSGRSARLDDREGQSAKRVK